MRTGREEVVIGSKVVLYRDTRCCMKQKGKENQILGGQVLLHTYMKHKALNHTEPTKIPRTSWKPLLQIQLITSTK